MIKNIFKILLLLVAIGYLVYAIGWLGHGTNEEVCTGMDLVIDDTLQTRLITQEDVQEIINNAKIDVDGKTMGDIDFKNIEDMLKMNPYIDSVQCYFTAENKVCIRVIPMHPILHIMANNGEQYYLDRSGATMPVGSLNADLCVATGNITKQFASTGLVELGILLQKDSFWKEQAQQIHVVSDKNIIIIPQTGDFQILLGEPRNLKDKLDRMKIFYEKGLPKTGWNKYETISLEFDGQVVGKKRK